MARALKIEKQNARSLNRWEESEQERLQMQREKLEAMRNRKLEGPVIRYWSGAVTWQWREGPDGPVYVKLKYKQQPKVQEVDEVAEKKKAEKVEIAKSDKGQFKEKDEKHPESGQIQDQTMDNMDVDKPTKPSNGPSTADQDRTLPATPTSTHSPQKDKQDNQDPDVSMADLTEETTKQEALPKAESTAPVPETSRSATVLSSEQDPSKAALFIDGIDVYAAQSEEQHLHQPNQTPIPTTQQQETLTVTTTFTPLPSMPPYQHIPHHLSNTSDPSQTTAASLPLMRERAARTLLILDSFPSLDATSYPQPSKRTSTTGPSISTALTSILLPDAHPDLSPEERKYLLTKHKRETAKEREDLLPPAPPRSVCHISGKTARFRDPKTGLAYRDMATYKAVQRVLANGCQWSALLDVWSGIVGEGALGRVAKGVPEGFWSGRVRVKADGGEVIVVD